MAWITAHSARSVAPVDHDAAGSATLLQATSTDVDEHCATLGRWCLNYDQISAGAFRGSFTQLSLARIEVFREVTSQQVRQHGQLGVDSFGIGLPWQAQAEVNCNGSSIAGAKAIVCCDAEVDMCTPREFEFRGVVMSAKLVEDLANSMDIELPRPIWHQLRAIEVADAPVARLRQLLAMIQDTITCSSTVLMNPATSRALEDAILIEIAEMLPTARPCDEVRSAAARRRTVNRACELMLERHDRPVSILEVCKYAGASRRKLNYCFQEVLGTTPIKYWRAMRLSAVRRDLKRCNDPRAGVLDIAARHGFWHFSQFSLDYKGHFYELPSETLRRARTA
jgi:AraC family transcriptional regulator, ethanolamine operon transcriptional activator